MQQRRGWAPPDWKGRLMMVLSPRNSSSNSPMFLESDVDKVLCKVETAFPGTDRRFLMGSIAHLAANHAAISRMPNFTGQSARRAQDKWRRT